MAQKPPPFDDFIVRMMQENKLTAPQLTAIVGRQTANRLQDNADNYSGMPALGPGTGKVLHGQLHEFTGSIADIKARIADKVQQKISPDDEPDSSKSPQQTQPSPNDPLKPRPGR